MKYYDTNQNLIPCPYGLLPIGKYLTNVDKKVLVESIDEYHSSTIDYDQYDMIFLYEWSGLHTTPTQLTEKFFVFHYNYTSADNINTFYYPHWLFYVSNAVDKYFEPTTTYPFACACRNFNNGRSGKIYNYQLLKNKIYFNKILISKFKSIEPFDLFALPDIADPKFKTIVEEFLIDYNTWQTMNSVELGLVHSMTTLDLDVYKKSLFNIIAETYIHHTILSEKTFKVFAAGQIPIMCGPQGAIEHLRQLGFDVFDDIVDHSYDNIENWQERIEAMQEILDNTIQTNHSDILYKTQQRRHNNWKHLHSVELQYNLLEPIVKRIIG
jgi:hypothetical protein